MVSLGLNIFHALSLSLLANGLAIPDEKSLVTRDVEKVLKLDFDVLRKPKTASTSNITNITKLQNKAISKGTVPVTLSSQVIQYTLPLKIGSKKEEVIVAIDTGSSDLWVAEPDTACAPQKDTPINYCKTNGTFSPSQSSTWRDYHEAFEIGYVDGTNTSGLYGQDDITISDRFTVKDVTFASINQSSVDISGILGIGFASLEASNKEYHNFPELLVSQGLTNRNAYSLYLNSVESATGSLLFGGIDHAKYEGSLITLPVDSQNDLSLTLNTISSEDEEVTIFGSYVLDSGTSITYVSDPGVFNTALNAYFSDQYGSIIVDCNPPADKHFTFEFEKNAKIKVPYTAFTGPLYDDNGKDTGLCTNLYGEGSLLGDNFLRSAYVVYDLDETTISLAQVKYTSESNITAFPPKNN